MDVSLERYQLADVDQKKPDQRNYPVQKLEESPALPAEDGIEGSLDGWDPNLDRTVGEDDLSMGICSEEFIDEEDTGNVSHSLDSQQRNVTSRKEVLFQQWKSVHHTATASCQSPPPRTYGPCR